MPQGREDVEREKQGVSYNAITTRSLIGRVHLSRYKKKDKKKRKMTKHLMRISESAVRHCAGVAAQADTDTNYIVIVLFLFLLM